MGGRHSIMFEGVVFAMKNFGTVTNCHRAMMDLMLVTSLVSACLLILGMGSDSGTLANIAPSDLRLYGSINLVNAAGLICGITYLRRGYNGVADTYFRSFLLLTLIKYPIGMWLTVRINSYLALTAFEFTMAVDVIKAALLLALVFMKGLDRKSTWIVFGTYVALDVFSSFLFPITPSTVLYRLVSALSKFALDVAIGLCIHGKFEVEVRGPAILDGAF